MERFKNILLLADDASWQGTVLQRAVSLAGHNQAELTIIHPLNFPHESTLSSDPVYVKLKNALREERKKQIGEVIATGTAGVNLKTRVIEGRAFIEIIREVLLNGYDLVIKGAEENSTLKDRIFGGTDMHLLRKCPCPVWIMKSNEKTKYRRIIAAIDVDGEESEKKVSSLNRQILEMASSLALSEFSELHIVHAWTAWGEGLLNTPRFNFTDDGEVAGWVEQQRVADETKINNLMEFLTEIHSRDTIEYLKPQLQVVKGEAHEIIPNLAREKKVDLVVMGTVARTGIPGLIMGNTAETILNNIGCSVLAVKPQGFVSPVTLGG